MRISDSKHAKLFNDKYPIITSYLPGWKEINPILEQGIRSVGDDHDRKTNVKAYMTDLKMWEAGKPASAEFQLVCRHALELAMEHAPDQAKQYFKPSVTECWGAVYSKDDFTVTHDHWPAIWSFSYYVNVTDACSPILFPNAKFALQPKNGMMCMFPGWVAHKVPKQKGEHDRVMIAGNIVDSQ